MMALVGRFFTVFFLSMSLFLGAISMEAFVAILNGRIEEDKKPKAPVTRLVQPYNDQQIWEQIERGLNWQERERKKSICRCLKRAKL
jgi:hypothetical protein